MDLGHKLLILQLTNTDIENRPSLLIDSMEAVWCESLYLGKLLELEILSESEQNQVTYEHRVNLLVKPPLEVDLEL